MNRLLCILLLLPALSTACDPQESPNYEGEPLATLRGSVTSNESAPSEAQAGVLWLTSDTDECQGPTLSCGYGVSGMTDTDDACVQACGEPECTHEALAEWEACAQQCGATVTVQTDAEYETCVQAAIGERVAVNTDTFPSQFEIEIYDVPSDDTLLRGHDEGPRVAFGVLVALSSSAPETFDLSEEGAFDSLLGAVESHALVYAADPIPAESAWGQYLGGAYDVGFHLMRFEADVVCEEPDLCWLENVSRTPAPEGLDADLELKLAPLEQLVLPH